MGGTQRTGTANLFDGVQHTASSEYSTRSGERIDTLQIHHATMTSLSGLIDLMMPGGRTVSANGAMGNDGTLIEVVPLPFRAFTSASSYDRRSLTVECCNTTLGPSWGISAATRTRLAQLAADMFRIGLLGGLDRRFIIGHYEVPGTYATACPGPDMHLDAIVAEANAIYNGTTTDTEDEMSAVGYYNVVGGTRANIGEVSFEELLTETHGDMADTYAAVSSFYYEGVDVPPLHMAVLRQMALDRRAALVVDITSALLPAIQAIGAAVGANPEGIRDLVAQGVAEYYENNVPALDLSEDDKSEIADFVANEADRRDRARLDGIADA